MQYNDEHLSIPPLLKAIELILVPPSTIKGKVGKLKDKQKAANVTDEQMMTGILANKLIASYSTKAGITGGATALIGIVPGMGTAVELVGGTTADIALCMKYQIEMVMALAHLYGHDIENDTERKRYFIIAGLTSLNMEALKHQGEKTATVFSRLLQRYVQKSSPETVSILFRKVSISFSKRALKRAIPFGVGAVVGFSSNKILTRMVGQKARDLFASASII